MFDAAFRHPDEVPLRTSADMRIEGVERARAAVREGFSLPHMRYTGSHSGCSCGFPSIRSDVLIEYVDGIVPETDEGEKDLSSVLSLLDLIPPLIHYSGQVEIYRIWDLEETFFFHEQFLRRVSR